MAIARMSPAMGITMIITRMGITMIITRMGITMIIVMFYFDDSVGRWIFDSLNPLECRNCRQNPDETQRPNPYDMNSIRADKFLTEKEYYNERNRWNKRDKESIF